VRGRQARLRSAFSEWYPGIEPETWHDAVWVREMVLAQQRHGSPRWALKDRILAEEHFQFQGSTSPSPGQQRQRMPPPEPVPFPATDQSGETTSRAVKHPAALAAEARAGARPPSGQRPASCRRRSQG
jgi:hypothetical protein